MNRMIYLWKIFKDRFVKPYDEIILRYNTKAEFDDSLIWRIFINGQEMLASSFEIHGFVQDVQTIENGVQKYNVGCRGRVRWEKSKAIIFTAKKPVEVN